MAVELLEEVPQLDAVLVPISGGGMAAGVCIAVKAINPDIKSWSRCYLIFCKNGGVLFLLF